jgi:hypothetical protein
MTATISNEPADIAEPAVGEGHLEALGQEHGSSAGLFSTSPPGASGHYTVNPELRVRY